MANAQADDLSEMNILDSSSRVHYGLLKKNKETAISSEIVLLLPPENITSFDLRLFKIFKAALVATNDDALEQ